MSPLGWLHTGCALAALASGAAVLLRRKGTRWHRRLGWVYAGSMVALNATALLIYRLSGTFGPFHVAALLSLATVAVGVLAAVRRQPADRWLVRHYYWMTFSYVGLVAAAASEAATRLSSRTFWWAVAGASAAVMAAGAFLVKRRARTVLEPFRRPAG
jgi:uncharacterized membrane protein